MFITRGNTTHSSVDRKHEPLAGRMNRRAIKSAGIYEEPIGTIERYTAGDNENYEMYDTMHSHGTVQHALSLIILSE